MKTFKEIREGYVSAAQRKAVWASRADGGKGKNETIMTSAERAKEMQKKANAAKKKAQGQAAKAGYKAEGKDDYAKAMADYKAKGGKITKVAPGKAAGYHGKDDPGKDMKGMMDKGDTKAIGTRKKVKSMGEAKQTHMFDNEKDARAKAKEIGGKYVKGTGKSMGKHAAIKESVASVAASAKGDHKAHMKAAKAHAIAAIKHMDQYKETNDSAHQKAAKLHRKAEQSHEGTAKLHKTSNNGQTKMTRTSIANKATAAANAASEDV